jgi:uncharacterized protein YndB with AHSA1/START domain
MSQQNPDVVVEKFINASPERIWKALTDGSEIEKWFFTSAETDPRPGGSYKMKWESKKDNLHNHNRWGNYLKFVPNKELQFEWRGLGKENKSGHAFDPTDEHLTIVTITLTPENNGTRVKLIHSGWGATPEWEASRKGHNEGWTFYLDNLASVIESGTDLRLAEGHQRVKAV